MWKSIRSVRSKSADQSVSLVATRIVGGLHECISQEDVEAAIMEMCKKRFSLTYGTPLMNERKLAQALVTLVNQLQLLIYYGGPYEFPAEIDRITTELLTFIHDLVHMYSTPSLLKKIHIQEYKKVWVTCRKKTSSSYSGLHFDHYKASVNNDFLASMLKPFPPQPQKDWDYKGFNIPANHQGTKMGQYHR